MWQPSPVPPPPNKGSDRTRAIAYAGIIPIGRMQPEHLTVSRLSNLVQGERLIISLALWFVLKFSLIIFSTLGTYRSLFLSMNLALNRCRLARIFCQSSCIDRRWAIDGWLYVFIGKITPFHIRIDAVCC